MEVRLDTQTNAPSISAFFPAYNDGGTIGSMVVTTIKTLEEITDDFEVFVVENGSTDYTVEVLAELAEQYPERFRYLAQDRKSTRLNSSHLGISYAVFCLKKKNK